jgi:trans-aconitate methyltransferase
MREPAMPEQTWNPRDYNKYARFVTDLGAGVVKLLDPQPGERILDLGCGDGVITKKLVDSGCRMVGVDASPEFIVAARGLGLDARHMDGQALTFNEEFDAVFSNAALHWMKDLGAVIDGVWRALRPGGRFVAEMGGKGNIEKIEKATRRALRKRGLDKKVPEPNVYPSDDEYRGLLEKRGFQVSHIQLFARPTALPKDIKTWLKTFRKSHLDAVAEKDREAFLTEIQEEVRPFLCSADGRWTADYVRLRFAAFKP